MTFLSRPTLETVAAPARKEAPPQVALFDLPPKRGDDADTSHQAAVSITSEPMTCTRQMVLEALKLGPNRPLRNCLAVELPASGNDV